MIKIGLLLNNNSSWFIHPYSSEKVWNAFVNYKKLKLKKVRNWDKVVLVNHNRVGIHQGSTWLQRKLMCIYPFGSKNGKLIHIFILYGVHSTRISHAEMSSIDGLHVQFWVREFHKQVLQSRQIFSFNFKSLNY